MQNVRREKKHRTRGITICLIRIPEKERMEKSCDLREIDRAFSRTMRNQLTHGSLVYLK